MHSSPCGRRMQKRKDTLAYEFFALSGNNRKKAPKFPPRLQKFLTEPSGYTEEKEQETFRVWLFLLSFIKNIFFAYCKPLRLTK